MVKLNKVIPTEDNVEAFIMQIHPKAHTLRSIRCVNLLDTVPQSMLAVYRRCVSEASRLQNVSFAE